VECEANITNNKKREKTTPAREENPIAGNYPIAKRVDPIAGIPRRATLSPEDAVKYYSPCDVITTFLSNQPV